MRFVEGRPHRPIRPGTPRLLLIRPDHIGDVILTSPTVEMLREALPDAHLTMMAGPWSADVARRDPLLDELAVCPFPGFARERRASALEPYRLMLSASTELRRRRFDAALLLRFDHWWGAWLTALARIPVRAGYAVAESAPFLTHSVQPSPREHWAERSLQVGKRLLGAWGVNVPEKSFSLRFGVREKDAREAAHLRNSLGLGAGRRLVILHSGSGAALKLWPEASWVQLGRALAQRDAGIVVTGSTAEAGVVDRIVSQLPAARSLAGKTDLGVLAALFRSSDLVIGVDSGPLHLAVAMDVPSVHLFGPTDPEVFGPWGDARRHRVVTANWPGAPCGRLDLEPLNGESPACMNAITVSQVLAECLSQLGIRE
jgi:ADP-heptose:LPS heptosyltransferase